MGFGTTMTTQLKSVGDAVQIVALLIGGTIILNVPNCELWIDRTIVIGPISHQDTNQGTSSPNHGFRGQRSLHGCSRLHGLLAPEQYLG